MRSAARSQEHDEPEIKKMTLNTPAPAQMSIVQLGPAPVLRNAVPIAGEEEAMSQEPGSIHK
jgi:hypothetical protein